MNLKVFRTTLAVTVFVAAPLTLAACDMLKKGDGADAAAVVAPPPTAPTAAPVAAETATATATAPVAPLGAAVTPAPGVRPVTTDAGKPADGGAAVDAGVVNDGGKAPPTPTPAFTIPTAIPGFDAAAFKPPPGFPSTLPTFPQPPPPPPAK